MTVLVVVAATIGIAWASLRWLRVAQREHYHPDVARFAVRWWRLTGVNRLLVAVAILGIAVSLYTGWGVVVSVAATAVGPIGLGVRGRTSPLAWTARLRRLAGAVAAVVAIPIVIDLASGTFVLTAIAVVALPAIFDAVLALLERLETRLGDRWVRQAAAALRQSGARVVAITGSYGKTSTKGMVGHLLAGVTTAVPSPASFNNRMGLARAINEHLAPGTDVFVAEMGTYGRGEIAGLCEWIPPDVAVITAIGPVHLERMGSEENIAAAKREILEHAPVAVVSIDHPLLAAIAHEESGRRTVIRCSGRGGDAEVVADPDTGMVRVGGVEIGRFDPDEAHAGNVACAVGAVVGLGFDAARIGQRLGDLPTAPHRQTVAVSERGFSFIDDTFNANPTGARAALALLARQPGSGRRVLVTPGMVELGRLQFDENRAFAAAAGSAGVDTMVVVGSTNREALQRGAKEVGVGSVIVVPTRDEAVAWVREHLGPGDAVLYENDLPDHYP